MGQSLHISLDSLRPGYKLPIPELEALNFRNLRDTLTKRRKAMRPNSYQIEWQNLSAESGERP